MSWAIRYLPDTDLGRRFKGHSQPFADRGEADRLRLACVNAADMEVIEVDEEPDR